MIHSLLNGLAWSSLIVAGLLLLGDIYCLSTSSRGAAGQGARCNRQNNKFSRRFTPAASLADRV
jgi:hypothetical protein